MLKGSINRITVIVSIYSLRQSIWFQMEELITDSPDNGYRVLEDPQKMIGVFHNTRLRVNECLLTGCSGNP